MKMLRQYDQIFLDLDGTILDGKYRNYQCYVDIISVHNGRPLSLEEYWMLKRQRTSTEEILKLSAIDEITPKMYNDEFISRIELPDYLKLDRLKPEIMSALEQMRRYTSELNLITMRKNEMQTIIQLKKLTLFEKFDRVIICSRPSESKYDRLAHIKAEKVLIVGDTEVDYETAEKLHADFIGISNGIRDLSCFDMVAVYPEVADIFK